MPNISFKIVIAKLIRISLTKAFLDLLGQWTSRHANFVLSFHWLIDWFNFWISWDDTLSWEETWFSDESTWTLLSFSPMFPVCISNSTSSSVRYVEERIWRETVYNSIVRTIQGGKCVISADKTSDEERGSWEFSDSWHLIYLWIYLLTRPTDLIRSRWVWVIW